MDKVNCSASDQMCQYLHDGIGLHWYGAAQHGLTVAVQPVP